MAIVIPGGVALPVDFQKEPCEPVTATELEAEHQNSEASVRRFRSTARSHGQASSRSTAVNSAPASWAPRAIGVVLSWRTAVYFVAATVAILITATLAPLRLVALREWAGLLGLIAVAGLLTALAAPLARVWTGADTLPAFSGVSLAVNCLIGIVAWRLQPGMSVSVAGAIVLALVLVMTATVAYSLVDENKPHPNPADRRRT